MAVGNFYNKPKTAIFFGKGAENDVGELVKQYSDKILFVNDNQPFLAAVYERIRASLDKAGVKYWELNKVVQNPRMSTIYEGIKLVNDEGIGCILGCGGGSVMDTEKFIAFGAHKPDKDPWTFKSFMEPVTWDVIPHGAVCTLPGTGAEFSNCVMAVDDKDENNLHKGMFNDGAIVNDFAVINPELAYTLPAFNTACGGWDAITHCLEVYLCNGGNTDLSENLFEGCIKTLLKYTPMAVTPEGKENYEVRSQMCLSVIIPCSNLYFYEGVPQDWGTHWLEAPITTIFRNVHGASLACIMPAWMEVVIKNRPQAIPQFCKFAVNCMGAKMNYDDPKATALEGVKLIKDWLHSVGLSTDMHDLKNPAAATEWKRAFDQCFTDHPDGAGMFYGITKEEAIEIYKLAGGE